MDLLFYDGDCGMCHGTVRFVAARDRADVFRYAPLGGPTFRERVPLASQVGLPDSIVLLTESGELLTKSSAAIYMLKRLGGVWRLTGILMGAVPGGIRDVVYDFVARIRHRLFAKPEGACPLLPANLRACWCSATRPRT